ncbi:MAG: manganese efflux pump MntP [Solirubrobacteraceae bacterium]
MLTILLVALSVGLDNFAASLAIGLGGVNRELRLRVALVFGLFEAGMPVIGLLIGRGVAGALGSSAHYIAGGLLIAAGAQVAFESIRHRDGPPALAGAPLRQMVILGAGLSIDNLVVGFALGAKKVPLLLAIVVIGLVSVGLSLVGLELGSRLGERVERGSEFLAAGVLAGVGLAIVLKLL